MSERAKGFGLSSTIFNPISGAARLVCEAKAVASMLDRATPHPGMGAAPVAPARGTMRIEQSWDVLPGGTRKKAGTHGVDMCQLEVMVAQAARRHAERTPDAPFVPPFTSSQIAVARDYRALVEWREGSALRCSSLEAGRSTGAGGSGLFIDSFIQQGRWLAELHRRIGHALAMDVRRHMDRDNARRPITVRAVVDMVVVAGQDLSGVLSRFGWQADGKNRKTLRSHLVGALDRMQGYRE
jgi:hypothetical protein